MADCNYNPDAWNPLVITLVLESLFFVVMLSNCCGNVPNLRLALLPVGPENY